MSDVPFYRTQMGHRFYEHTVPELARQIGRVADLLERIVVAQTAEKGGVGLTVTAPTAAPPTDR
jgi:hypothetical protein